MRTSGNKPNETQERRVLKVLQEANGAWVNGQHFLRTMFLSQYHRAIHNLQHKRERYIYDGVIEASEFTDEFGFKAYRLVPGMIITPEPVMPETIKPGEVIQIPML